MSVKLQSWGRGQGRRGSGPGPHLPPALGEMVPEPSLGRGVLGEREVLRGATPPPAACIRHPTSPCPRMPRGSAAGGWGEWGCWPPSRSWGLALGETAIGRARRERKPCAPAKVNSAIAVPRLRAPTGAPVPGACASGVLPPAPQSFSSSHVCSYMGFSSWPALGAARSRQHPLSPRGWSCGGAETGFGTVSGTEPAPGAGGYRDAWGPVHPAAGAGAPTSPVEGEMRVLGSSGSCSEGRAAEPDTGALRVPSLGPRCPKLHAVSAQPAPPNQHPSLATFITSCPRLVLLSQPSPVPHAVPTGVPDGQAAGGEGAVPPGNTGHGGRLGAAHGTARRVAKGTTLAGSPLTPRRLQGGARRSQTPCGCPATPAGSQPCLAPAPCPFLPAHATGGALAQAPARSAPASRPAPKSPA